MEIEKKFLVEKLPNLEGCKFYEIEQAYLTLDKAKKEEERIRKLDDKFFYTIKKGVGLQREENEMEISKERYFHLKKRHIGSIITKRRYKICLQDNLFAELDVYSGDLEGLKIVEVEFQTVEQAISFNPPSWFGKDVTTVEDYKNAMLSTQGLPTKNAGLR